MVKLNIKDKIIFYRPREMNPERESSTDSDLFVNTTAFLIEGENGLELVFNREEKKCEHLLGSGKCDLCEGDVLKNPKAAQQPEAKKD